MHDRLIRLISEIGLIPLCKVCRRPLLHLSELLLGRPDLDPSIDTVSGQWTGALLIPLFEHLLLDFGVSTNEVIKGLDVGLGAVNGESKVVVLEVSAHAWKVDQGLDTSPAQLLRVTKSRPLKNKWGTHGTRTDDDLLPGLEDPANWLSAVERLSRDCHYSHSTTIFNNHLLNFGIALKVEIGMFGSGAVDIGVGRITSSS